MKRFILMFCMLYGISLISYSQNLDSLSSSERNALLLSMSKEIIMKYGPGYYNEYKKPKIERKIYHYDPRIETEEDMKLVGRAYYVVTYYYDKKKEKLAEDYSARVSVMADTGLPRVVGFGNGWGVFLNLPKTRNSGEKEPFTPYESIPLK